MKRLKWIYVGLVALLMANSCAMVAQEQNSNCCKSNKPCVHITVHKQLDKDGNIVSYDSVYSYTFGGNITDTGFMDSLMRNRDISIQMHVRPDGSIDFMSDPFFQNFDMNIDMDQMQKMMEKQMQYLMQNAGMTNNQIYFPPARPRATPPANREKQKACPKKKCAPKHNVANQGVQI